MPCLPGFLPVAKLLQAGALFWFGTDRRGALTPDSMRRAMLGSLPAAAQGLIRSKVAPSRPIINKRGCDDMVLFSPGGLLLTDFFTQNVSS